MTPLELNDFRAWLESRPLDAVVGQSDNLTACPVATWQREQYNNPISVSADTIVCFLTGEELEAPGWVGDFVQEIDRYHADEGEEELEYREEPVTAYECLQVVGLIS